ncbi:MAG: transposase [Thermoflexales bacterium]
MIREKKHRLPRAAFCGNVLVAFTACVAESRRLFTLANADVVAAFVSHLRRSAAATHCEVPAYCFMPNHAHVLIQGADGLADTWQAMTLFKQLSGFWLGRRSEVQCVWQKDFYDHVTRSSRDVGSQARYIVNNPVRAGLVARWDEYPYSGAFPHDLRDILASAPSA